MSNVLATVIIPNWNGKNLLADCLPFLEKQTFKNFEVLVVDNGSTDDSIEFLNHNFSKVKVLPLDKNYGFAYAINRGVENCNSKYVVLLNNDTAVDKNWLKYLIHTAEKHPECGSIGSKLLNYFNRQIIDGVGILINEVGQAKSIGWQEEDQGQYQKEIYIFGATGGASLFNREVFINVGMFDQNYFMYSEEVDWAFRAQFLGYKSLYCPKAVIYHKHKMSSKKQPQYLEYWQFKNMTQTIIKDFPAGLLLKRWRWLKIILVHLNTILYQLKNGYYWPPFMTEFWLIIHLPSLLISRSKVQSNRKVSDEYIDQFFVDKPITFWGLTK